MNLIITTIRTFMNSSFATNVFARNMPHTNLPFSRTAIGKLILISRGFGLRETMIFPGLLTPVMGATLTIPGTGAFDTGLGTLVSVEVLIEPPAATLTSGGSHSHAFNPQSHSALRQTGGTYGNGTTIDFLPFTVNAIGAHTVIVEAVSLSTSFGTVTLPSIISSSEGSHTHIIDFAPVVVSSGVYDLPSTFSQVAGEHTHGLSYSPFLQTYSGADLEPFLSGNPTVTIDPPPSAYGGFPFHSHQFPSGYYAAIINGGATENIFIPVTTSSLTTGTFHGFDLNPFQVTSTTFTYDPVPEPGTAGLVSLSCFALTLVRRRRRPSQQDLRQA